MNYMRQLKKILSVTLAVVIILQFFAGNYFIYASEQDGFTVTHQLQENKTGDVQAGNFLDAAISRTLGERVVAKLQYSTAGITTTFTDVVISYVLPAGTTYLAGDSIYSGHVKSTSYDAGTRTLDITLSNDNNTNVFDSGKSGELLIAFEFNNPSPYPDGTTVDLNESIINYKSDDVAKFFNLDARVINYTLVDSWNITKTPDATLTIPSDPTVLTIEEDYTIQLKDGNINLKNVEVVDTLPDHVVSATASNSGVVDIPGKTITWTLADVSAGSTTELTASLTYTIDRDGDGNDDGVADTRNRVNQVSVTGEKITTNSSNVQVTTGAQQTFLQNSDTATTTFQRSTAVWELVMYWDRTEALPPKESITTYDVDYRVRLRDGDITLKDAVLVYTLPPSVSAVPDPDGGTVSALDPNNAVSAGTITWNEATLNVGTHNWNVTLTYNIDRDGDLNDDGVSNGRTRVSSSTITANEIDKDGNTGPAYVFLAGDDTDSVTTTFTNMDIEWDANKDATSGVSGSDRYYLPFINADEYSSNITYRLSLDTYQDGSKTGVEFNVPVKTVTFTDDLPDYAEYVSHSSNATVDNFTNTGAAGEVLTFNLIAVPDNTNPYVDVVVKYNIDGDLSGNGVDPITNNTQANSYTVSNAKDGDGDAVAIDGDTTGAVTVTFQKSSDPNPNVTIEIQGYDKYNGNYNTNNYNQTNASTYPGDKNYELGDQIVYLVDMNNNGNGKDLLGTNKTYLDIGNLPTEIDYTIIELGQSDDSVDYTVVLTTFDISEGGSDTINLGPFDTLTKSTIDVTGLGLDTDEYITDIRILYTEDVPNGFNYDDEDIKITDK